MRNYCLLQCERDIFNVPSGMIASRIAGTMHSTDWSLFCKWQQAQISQMRASDWLEATVSGGTVCNNDGCYCNCSDRYWHNSWDSWCRQSILSSLQTTTGQTGQCCGESSVISVFSDCQSFECFITNYIKCYVVLHEVADDESLAYLSRFREAACTTGLDGDD